jgi:hypothetical protein
MTAATMTCAACGATLDIGGIAPGSRIECACGAQAEVPRGPRFSILAFVALALPLLSFLPLGIFPGLAAVVVAVIAIVLIRRSKVPVRGLWIAVAGGVLGLACVVLAFTAMFTARSRLAELRESEAAIELSRIARGAELHFVMEEIGPGGVVTGGQLPPDTPLTPDRDCCSQPGGRCPPDPSAWLAEGWRATRFELAEPHHFRYQIERTPDGFIARAVGDPSCEGDRQVWEAEVRIAGSRLDIGEPRRVE